MKRRLLRTSVGLGALLLAGALLVTSGLVPVKASSGHWAVTAWALHFAMQRSVATHSLGIEAPALDDRRLVAIGAGHFHGGCRPCHGAPGEPRSPIALAMTPHPPDLRERVLGYDDGELFYIVRHGVKFTGMPAWPAIERRDEVWAVVAFLRVLPELDEAQYRRLVHGEDTVPPERAPALVLARCARCHGADGLGREEAFPRLAGQQPVYLAAALRAYASGARRSGIMQPIAATLDEASITSVADWYAERPRPPAAGGPASPEGERIARDGLPERRIPACADCHGLVDEPKRPDYPRLSGQRVAYLVQQLQLFAREARGGGRYAALMQEVPVHTLAPAQMEAVARYYASSSQAEASRR